MGNGNAVGSNTDAGFSGASPIDVCDIMIGMWEMISVCRDETDWDELEATMNIVGVAHWMKIAMESGKIRFASNLDIKVAIYHMLAEHHGGECLGRKFASSRGCIPARAVKLYRDWLDGRVAK